MTTEKEKLFSINRGIVSANQKMILFNRSQSLCPPEEIQVSNKYSKYSIHGDGPQNSKPRKGQVCFCLCFVRAQNTQGRFTGFSTPHGEVKPHVSLGNVINPDRLIDFFQSKFEAGF